MEQLQDSTQAQDEKRCIETFLDWYNKRWGAGLVYQRAERVFPEIGNSTRWDFVIRGDRFLPWYATEIKRLINPETRIKLMRWNRFLRSITNRLANKLQGEFLVYGVPSLKLERQRRTELKRVLTDLLLSNAASMRNDEMVNLGSQILERFSEWPSTPHLNMSLSPPIEHRVNEDSCFTLHKISDTGCSFELGFAQSGAFRLNQVVIDGLNTLFDNGEVSQANAQLGLAKRKGAKGTILLLDYHLNSWYPNHVKEILANRMNSAQLSDIDSIYLIKASQKRVSEVWSARITFSSLRLSFKKGIPSPFSSWLRFRRRVS